MLEGQKTLKNIMTSQQVRPSISSKSIAHKLSSEQKGLITHILTTKDRIIWYSR